MTAGTNLAASGASSIVVGYREIGTDGNTGQSKETGTVLSATASARRSPTHVPLVHA